MTRHASSASAASSAASSARDELAAQRVELRRPVERQAHAPRRGRVDQDDGGRRGIGGGRGRPASPSSTTSASTASAPSADAMTGLQSISRMSSRSPRGRPTRHDQLGDGRRDRPRAGRGPRRAGERRAGHRASPGRRRGRSGREADRDVVEDLGQDAAEPDDDGRPERRVAAQADDQLDPGVGHRLHEEAADREAVASRRREQSRGRAADRRVADAARGRRRRGRSCGRARRHRA